MATFTKTFYPDYLSEYLVEENSVLNPFDPCDKGSDNTTYSEWDMCHGYGYDSRVIYDFDIREWWIPEGAVILSVTCSAKSYISDESRVDFKWMQMYSGSTPKGEAQTNITSTPVAQSIECGSWTRSELLNARIGIEGVRGTKGVFEALYMRFYGATLTVTYWLEDDIKGVGFGMTEFGNYTDVTDFTGFQGFNVETSSLTSENRVTTLFGKIFLGKHREKSEITVSFHGLTTAELVTVENFLKQEYFWVKYKDPTTGELKASNVYCSKRKRTHLAQKNGTIVWDGFDAVLTERT